MKRLFFVLVLLPFIAADIIKKDRRIWVDGLREGDKIKQL